MKNAPSISPMFMSKRGEHLQKTDSSSSSHYYPNNRNDTSLAGMEEGWGGNDTY